MSVAKTEYEVGESIDDRYKVQRILGRGGMGVVYLVEDTTNGQPRALKTLLPKYVNNPSAVRRFEREVNTLRRLEHQAIVNIYDAQRVGSLYYYTMDYVKGKSLVSWIQERGRLSMGSTVRVLALLADALEYAHQFTIHRDISPENIMVLPDGTVRLLDFGLVKLTDTESASFTMVGVRLGKMQYKAPEQHLDPTSVDARADLYSLGVMFYAMLTGTLPKKNQHITDIVPGLPKEVDAFAEKAMAHSAAERFQTAREFRIALLKLYKLCQEAERQQARAEKRVVKEGIFGSLKAKWRKWWEQRKKLRARQKAARRN